MLRWITEARRWIVLGLVVVGILFALGRYCPRCQTPRQPHRDLIEEAVKQGWGIDWQPTIVSEEKIDKETGLPAKSIKSTTTAEFEEPVEKIDIVVTEEGDVLVTGETEVGERLPPRRMETLRKGPTPEPWVKKDFGVALGLAWDFDNTVEPCVRIQTYRWFGHVTGPDPVISFKYTGVSVNFPLKLWVLKNTSIGGMLKWDYANLARAPDVGVVLTVRL